MLVRFMAFVPVGTKSGQGSRDSAPETLFKVFSGGVETSRDEVVYDFDKDALE